MGATDIGVGDSELAFLDVAPADGSTQVTLTVNPPTGSPFAVTMTAGDLVAIPGTTPVQYSCRFTSDIPVVYDKPAKWVLHYEVVGTGEGDEDLEVWVVASPVAGGPTWLPGRSRVAAYIPHRTLVRSTVSTIASEDAYAWTWDSTTTPPGTTVDRLIADGAAWVSARVSPMNTASEAASAVCVAMFAAAMIERSWPEDDQALQRANDLERRLDVLLKDLIAANNASNGTDDYGLEIVPMWSFPQADTRWDYPTYF